MAYAAFGRRCLIDTKSNNVFRVTLTDQLGSIRRSFHTNLRRYGAQKSEEVKEIKGIPYSKLKIGMKFSKNAPPGTMGFSRFILRFLGIPKESWPKECRVACSPVVAGTLTKKGFTVEVEKGAGTLASFRDQDYEAAGAKIVDRNTAFQSGKEIQSLRHPGSI
jgi:hypothetical protein